MDGAGKQRDALGSTIPAQDAADSHPPPVSSSGGGGGFMKDEDLALEDQKRQQSQPSPTDASKQELVERSANVVKLGTPPTSSAETLSSPTSTTPDQDHQKAAVAAASGAARPDHPLTIVTPSSTSGTTPRPSSPPSSLKRTMPPLRNSPPPTPPARIASSGTAPSNERRRIAATHNTSTLLQKTVSRASPSSTTSATPPDATSSLTTPAQSNKAQSPPSSLKRSPSFSEANSPPAKMIKLSNEGSTSSAGGHATQRARASSSSSSTSSSSLSSSPPRASTSTPLSPPLNGVDLVSAAKRTSLSPPALARAKSRSLSPPLDASPALVGQPSVVGPSATSPERTRGSSKGTTTHDTIGDTDQRTPEKASTSSSVSSSSSSPSPPSSPVQLSFHQPPMVARRVKVYALYDSNWLDLGTGSCTYHRGISHITKKRVPRRREAGTGEGPSARDKGKGREPQQQQQQPDESSATSNDSEKTLGDADLEDFDTVEVQELIELDMSAFPTNSGRAIEGLEENEEEASWIEVAKEGKWKTDAQPSSPTRAKKAKTSDASSGSPTAKNEQALLQHQEAEEDTEDDYERTWTTRIEKPDPTPDGMIDLAMYSAQLGADEGEEVIGRYRRQQETLIVWKPMNGDTEMALSFAATIGCAEIWEFLKVIHSRWEMEYLDNLDTEAGRFIPLNGSSGDGQHGTALEEEEDDDDDDMARPGGRAHYASNSKVIGLASSVGAHGNQSYGLGLGPLSAGANVQSVLPDPTLSNLGDLDRTIKTFSRSAQGREKLSALILKTDFLHKLVPVFSEAEDLESTPDLHMMCMLLHSIINLNDHSLWDFILSDEIFLDLVSILEYDPDFPTMKALYRAHLSNPALYKEVVPIKDEGIRLKIHQIYRSTYMKDVILPRVLDDSAFSLINSYIYFHQVDITQYFNGNDEFWRQLFSLFPEEGSVPAANKPASSASDSGPPLSNGSASSAVLVDRAKQHDAIAFLQSYCQMLKQIQVGLRTQAFHILTERGLIRILEYALAKLGSNDSLRVATVEILMLFIDNDINSIRSYILKVGEKDTKKKSLMFVLIDCFVKEQELGIKSQLAEAIRVLLLPPGDAAATETAAVRTRPDDPNADKFLQYFYENGVTILLEPLTKGLTPAEPGQVLELDLVQIALYTHLCDLLCFFVNQHSFRSKFFILSSSVTAKVAALLQARPKHIRLAALRFFRACVGRNDDFYNRYLVKNDIFRPLLALSKQETMVNNLLASACLEFFEYIRVNNIKSIVNHLGDRYVDDLKDLGTMHDVFVGIIAKYEQNHEPPPTADTSTGPDDAVHGESALLTTSSDAPVPDTRHELGALTTEEENYFATDDDDEEDDEDHAATSTDPLSAVLSGGGLASQPLRRSDSSAVLSRYAGHSGATEAKEGDKPAKDETETSKSLDDANSSDAAEPTPLPPPSTDPDEELAKIREKRKREEMEEEEEEDLLASKKKAANKSSATAPAGSTKSMATGGSGGKPSSNPLSISIMGRKKAAATNNSTSGAAGPAGSNNNTTSTTGKLKLLFSKKS